MEPGEVRTARKPNIAGSAITMTTQSITLPISGMTCASCVSHVETALKEVPGVAQTTVNLATEKATVQLADGNVSIGQLVTAVQDVGYDVPTETTTLTIKGMTCASCVDHVETALKELRGVNEAVVNLGLGTARVTFIPGVVTIGHMKQAVNEVGYEAIEPSKAADALDRERQARSEERRVGKEGRSRWAPYH